MALVKMRSTAVGLFIVGLAVLFSSGCTTVTPPPVEPDPCNVQVVTLDLVAAAEINPGENGAPRPVVVRLYQLANDLGFQNASYDAIRLKAAETLGEDLMKVDEVEVFPNDAVTISFERNPEASFLGGVALVREPQGQSYKTLYAFPPMPNTPEACQAAPDAPPEQPQAFPKTSFFVVSRKLDNGSEFDRSMFPNTRDVRHMSLSKRSAAPGAHQR